jgi:hypothetical protein
VKGNIARRGGETGPKAVEEDAHHGWRGSLARQCDRAELIHGLWDVDVAA